MNGFKVNKNKRNWKIVKINDTRNEKKEKILKLEVNQKSLLAQNAASQTKH